MMDNTIHYMGYHLEKSAGIGSAIAGMARGIGRFAKAPLRTTAKTLLWSRAKPGTIGQNISRELGYGWKWGGGLGLASIAATPMFTQRSI